MSGESGLIDIIIFIAVGIFIYTRFFGHTLPGGKPKRPGAKRKKKPTHLKPVKTEEAKPQPAKVVPLKPTKTGLAGLKEIDKNFNEKEFLNGAKQAFVMYHKAWEAEDEDTLASLLAPNLFDEVMDDLETAEAENKKPFLELDEKIEATIIDGRLNGRTEVIEVKYSAQILQDYIGQTAKSSRKKSKAVTQVWVWARPVESDDPNWQLEAINAVS
jgi:predicted lipid-binding transport protein (Tim44 family)